METQIKKLDFDAMSEEDVRLVLKEAGAIIRAGGLVAFPTETVYGLGGDALNPQAAKKIYAAKGRPSDNPLIIHVASMQDLTKIVKKLPEAARRLAERYWPGPLTMIFEKTELVPYEITGGMETVAVRMPDHPAALALIRESGGYIAAPSANTSGRPSPTAARHVAEDLAGRIPYIIDGGMAGIGLESTIVDFSGTIPTILRPGYITLEMAASVIGDVKMDAGLAAAKPKAPGMKYRHYAPKAQMTVFTGDVDAVIAAINEKTREKLEQGKRVGILCTDETHGKYAGATILSLGSQERPEQIASNLFAALREFDAAKVDLIFSESFSARGIGQAIQNRLLKAAGQRVIEVNREKT